ncbi:MAG TPA: sodium:solute symporter, partial [Leeuwenhoekiella sp.]|nr:sodium:solute symporter [Leeuwenhoekiella sp.]
FEGAGKFMTVILPWDVSLVLGDVTLLNAEQVYALILILLTTIYTIKGGMFSVVSTEVLQFGIMVLAGILVAGYTFFSFTDAEITALIPEEWTTVTFGSQLTGFWAGDFEEFNTLIDTQGYKMFGAFVGMSLFKGFFASIAGPTPSYDMQRILSTRTAKDTAYMSGFTNLVLFIPRYLMIAAIVLLGLVYIAPELANSGGVTSNDLEVILPQVINNHVPVGIKGLLLAGLLAAFMSTFSAFVNAGPAYIVNDIYKKYFKPEASDRHYVKASHVASFAVVTLGVIMGFFADSINSITLWITSSLYGGYVAANFLKWIWWRFNGWGYFWGMLSGLIVATLQFMIDQGASTYAEGSFLYWYAHIPAIYLFPVILGFSLLGSFLGTYLTPPTATKTLKRFYTSVHPWGWWKPVREQLTEEEQVGKNKDFGLDMFNCIVGIVWQSSMILLPIYLVVRDYEKTAVSFLVFGVTSLILKFTWLDKVKKLKN